MHDEPLDAAYYQDLLREHELSVTPFRVKLLKLLAKLSVPLSVQNIAAKFDEAVDKVTLYRNLEAFEHAGLVCRMYFNGQEALYEQRFTDHHHHHLICTNCGRIEDVAGCSIETPRTGSGFKINHHHLEFYGLCHECQLKKQGII
ncbi:transcriptional repressor [Patescibacteria group bacterium]|nr:transcriptional repressor [Patescibacteria group bacterium]